MSSSSTSATTSGGSKSRKRLSDIRENTKQTKQLEKKIKLDETGCSTKKKIIKGKGRGKKSAATNIPEDIAVTGTSESKAIEVAGPSRSMVENKEQDEHFPPAGDPVEQGNDAQVGQDLKNIFLELVHQPRPPTPQEFVVRIADARQFDEYLEIDIPFLITSDTLETPQIEPVASAPVVQRSNVSEVAAVSEEAPRLAEPQNNDPAPEIKNSEE